MNIDDELKETSKEPNADIFVSLLKDEMRRRKPGASLFALIDGYVDLVRDAREMGIGYVKLAEFLKDAAIQVSPEMVKKYCVSKGIDATKPRKKRRRRRLSTTIEGSQYPTQLKASQASALAKNESPKTRTGESRPGFRSALKGENL
jgi:hypothetical protein